MNRTIKKIVKIFLQQPLIETMRVFFKQSDNVALLVVIICASLSVSLFTVIMANDLELLFVMVLLLVSVISFGIGIMIADAFATKYKKQIIMGSVLFLVLVTVSAFFQQWAGFITLSGLIGIPISTAILLRNASVIHKALKRRKIRITITA